MALPTHIMDETNRFEKTRILLLVQLAGYIKPTKAQLFEYMKMFLLNIN